MQLHVKRSVLVECSILMIPLWQGRKIRWSLGLDDLSLHRVLLWTKVSCWGMHEPCTFRATSNRIILFDQQGVGLIFHFIASKKPPQTSSLALKESLLCRRWRQGSWSLSSFRPRDARRLQSFVSEVNRARWGTHIIELNFVPRQRCQFLS